MTEYGKPGKVLITEEAKPFLRAFLWMHYARFLRGAYRLERSEQFTGDATFAPTTQYYKHAASAVKCMLASIDNPITQHELTLARLVAASGNELLLTAPHLAALESPEHRM